MDTEKIWCWSARDSLIAGAAAIGGLLLLAIALMMIFGMFEGLKAGWPVLLIYSFAVTPLVIMLGIKRCERSGQSSSP